MSGLRGRVHQVSVNPAGGVPKRAVSAARLHPGGVEGDRQRNLRFHGGPDRAVCLFSLERIEQLCAEGHPISPGSTGENLTLAGIDWAQLLPGVRLRVGEAVLEAVSFAAPCKTIRQSFAEDDFTRLSQKLHPGWSRVYARVLEAGVVRPGDEVVSL